MARVGVPQEERDDALRAMLDLGVRGDVMVAAAAASVDARCFDIAVVRVMAKTLPVCEAASVLGISSPPRDNPGKTRYNL